MVCLDINPHFVFKAKAFEETVDRLRIEIILVLGWLMRLWLDQNRALEADLVFVFDDQRQETAEIFLLNAKVGVE